MGNDIMNRIGIPRLIISLFLAFLVAAAFSYGLPMGQIFSAMLTRFGMNALLVLAMIPTIQAGAGPNFGLPFGIICGLIGATPPCSSPWGSRYRWARSPGGCTGCC